jgi:hypothetical protein
MSQKNMYQAYLRMEALSGSSCDHGVDVCNGLFIGMSCEQWRELRRMPLPKIFNNLKEEQKSQIILDALLRIIKLNLSVPHGVKQPLW